MTTDARIHEAVADSLRQFGYPDVTAKDVAEVHEAMKNGQPLPHGIVGLFAERQLRDLDEVTARGN